MRFPYPTNQFTDMGINYKTADKHTPTIRRRFYRKAIHYRISLDDTRYWVTDLNWTGKAKLSSVSHTNLFYRPMKA